MVQCLVLAGFMVRSSHFDGRGPRQQNIMDSYETGAVYRVLLAKCFTVSAEKGLTHSCNDSTRRRSNGSFSERRSVYACLTGATVSCCNHCCCHAISEPLQLVWMEKETLNSYCERLFLMIINVVAVSFYWSVCLFLYFLSHATFLRRSS